VSIPDHFSTSLSDVGDLLAFLIFSHRRLFIKIGKMTDDVLDTSTI